MFSGKSSYLINWLIANEKVGRRILSFKPAKDDRYGENKIVSHNGIFVDALSIQSPLEVEECLNKHGRPLPDLLGFDEAQFFEANHMQKEVTVLLDRGYDVVIAGLAQNSFGEPFGAMGSLLAMADEIVQLPALCAKCKHNKATRTYRKNSSMDRVFVGGANDYESRCYKCWLE